MAESKQNRRPAALDAGKSKMSNENLPQHIGDFLAKQKVTPGWPQPGELNARLNKRERRAQQLLAHYETCERLARYLGATNPDGKKISVALFKLERDAHNAATAQRNGEAYNGQPYRNEDQWETFKRLTTARVGTTLTNGLGRHDGAPGFFVNGDPRGYALKIDNENPKGKALIDAVKLHTDRGGYGILSPEITGD